MDWTDSLKPLMKARGLTNYELAELIGTSAGAVSEFVTGRRIPSKELTRKIAEALDVAVQDLVRHEAMIVYHANEVALLEKYRSLNKKKKAAVDELLKVL